jgi:hypothetical protein
MLVKLTPVEEVVPVGQHGQYSGPGQGACRKEQGSENGFDKLPFSKTDLTPTDNAFNDQGIKIILMGNS